MSKTYNHAQLIITPALMVTFLQVEYFASDVRVNIMFWWEKF